MINSDEILKLKFDSSLNAVIMEWIGFFGSEEFREANEKVLELIRETGADRIIGDLREMRIIKLKNQEWLYQEWLPKAIDEGLRYAALVESEDFFNRKAVYNVVEQLEDKITIRYFKHLVSARAWIRSID